VSHVLFLFQGRHTKTGQLAAIKVMDVTEVSFFIDCRYTVCSIPSAVQSCSGSFTDSQKSAGNLYLISLLPLICSLNSYMGFFLAWPLYWCHCIIRERHSTRIRECTLPPKTLPCGETWPGRVCVHHKMNIFLMYVVYCLYIYVGYWFVLIFNRLH
jgi:hypothetical protein